MTLTTSNTKFVNARSIIRSVFGISEARQFKFGIMIELGECHPNQDKLSKTGAWSGHTIDRCHLYRFVDVVRIRCLYMVAFSLASLIGLFV